ncbi:MAG: hypothetical protein M1419_04740 [Bacteroidetes bacterium]|nr:hypothetical protein [Bacteroidota bacterium]
MKKNEIINRLLDQYSDTIHTVDNLKDDLYCFSKESYTKSLEDFAAIQVKVTGKIMKIKISDEVIKLIKSNLMIEEK